MAHDRIWLSWERQRRTIEMAREFSAELVIHEPLLSSPVRYIFLVSQTVMTLIKKRPKVLFVQNPSIVLAFTACLLMRPLNYTLIIDRHTNFKLDKRKSKNPKWLAFHCLSKFTNRKADAIIVTNRHLSSLIRSQCRKVFILPDRIPNLPLPEPKNSENPVRSGLFICTFSHDEPYREVIRAASRIPEIALYITGNFNRALSQDEIKEIPSNIHLLGFVPDTEYFEHLAKTDFTIILTNQEFTLNCGSYESISAGKPMLLASTWTIRSYFKKGAEYTNAKCEEHIRQSLLNLISDLQSKTNEIPDFRADLNCRWLKSKESIESFIKTT